MRRVADDNNIRDFPFHHGAQPAHSLKLRKGGVVALVLTGSYKRTQTPKTLSPAHQNKTARQFSYSTAKVHGRKLPPDCIVLPVSITVFDSVLGSNAARAFLVLVQSCGQLFAISHFFGV